MELKNIKPIIFSFVVSLIIAFVFLMATFYILAYSGPNALKDALSTTGSYFGAVATLGAAVIAAHLFNDWKEQHNKTILAGEAKLAFSLLHDERNILYDMKYFLSKKLDPSLSERLNVYDPNLSPLPDKLITMTNANRLKLAEFVFLIEGSQLYSDLDEYRKSITLLNKNITEWKFPPKTYSDVFENYNYLIAESLRLNFIILQALKSYILYKDKSIPEESQPDSHSS